MTDVRTSRLPAAPTLSAFVAAVGVLGVAGSWLGALTQDLDLAVFLAVAMALSAGPFLVYLRCIQGRVGTMVIGFALVATSLTLPLVFAARSSPVLGLLGALPLNWSIASCGVAWQRRDRSPPRRRSSPLRRGTPSPAGPDPALTWRRALAQAHRWLGLVAGGFVLALALSGTALLFRDEIDRLVYPHLYRSSPGAVTLDTAEAAVREAFPGWRLGRVHLPAAKGGVYQMALTAPSDETRLVFVDPGSGKVLGALDPDRRLTDWLYRLHADFLLGGSGRHLVAVAGVALAGMVATGFVLWRRTNPSASSARLRLRRHRGRYTFAFDLHRLVGVVAFVVLGLVAVTGVSFVYWDQTRSLWYAITAGDAPSDRPQPDQVHSHPSSSAPLSLSALAARVAAEVPGGRAMRYELPADRDGAVVARVSSPFDPRGGFNGYDGNVFLALDQYSGEVLVRFEPRRHSLAADVLENWAFPLHVGSFGRGMGRVAYAGVGVAPLVLLVTGSGLWLTRLRRRRRHHAG